MPMAELMLALALALGSAQPASPPLPPIPTPRNPAASLAWLEGNWRGPGVTMGNVDEAVLVVRPALGGAYSEFSYRAGAFEGRAFYRRIEPGRWAGTWFDSRGISFGIVANADGRTLTSDWGSDQTERGRTTYWLREDGQLRVYDAVRGPDGVWRAFAEHTLTRAD